MRRGAPIDRWQGQNFTDQNKARCSTATHVCEACVWACSWVQPPDRPTATDGKKGLNLRLFTHVCDDRGYRSLNKANKPEILRWLREPKSGARPIERAATISSEQLSTMRVGALFQAHVKERAGKIGEFLKDVAA